MFRIHLPPAASPQTLGPSVISPIGLFGANGTEITGVRERCSRFPHGGRSDSSGTKPAASAAAEEPRGVRSTFQGLLVLP
jgi:hypothetical protein